jgi:hypothetical protein
MGAAYTGKGYCFSFSGSCTKKQNHGFYFIGPSNLSNRNNIVVQSFWKVPLFFTFNRYTFISIDLKIDHRPGI